MDLDEFLSVSNQNCQETNRAGAQDERNAAVSGANGTVEVARMANLAERCPDVNNVVNSALPKASASPAKVSPVIFQILGNVEPTATNAIIQWCQSVGVSRPENQSIGPEPGRLPVKRRRNSKYVYNPLPIMKKADRKFVSQAKKDEKYWERRIKNNVAAKRSRDLRRQKEIEVSEKHKELEQENSRLKEEVQKLRMKAFELEQKLAHFKNADL